MAKKTELVLEEVFSNKNDINNMLTIYEAKLDSNYQDFLKALLSEIDIINLMSAISDNKIDKYHCKHKHKSKLTH